MKKILTSILCFFAFLFISQKAALADELAEVQAFFDKYVISANSYDKKIFDYYTPDAKIIRVVIKPDKTTQSVVIPFDRYKKELLKGQGIARVARYKNSYLNRSYDLLPSGDYKISATRKPSFDKTGLPSYFIVTKTNGAWKIKEESMNTKVQKFLHSK